MATRMSDDAITSPDRRSSRSKQPFPFLQLPAELRVLVYRLLCPIPNEESGELFKLRRIPLMPYRPDVIATGCKKESKEVGQPGLLLACWQLREEYLPIWQGTGEGGARFSTFEASSLFKGSMGMARSVRRRTGEAGCWSWLSRIEVGRVGADGDVGMYFHVDTMGTRMHAPSLEELERMPEKELRERREAVNRGRQIVRDKLQSLIETSITSGFGGVSWRFEEVTYESLFYWLSALGEDVVFGDRTRQVRFIRAKVSEKQSTANGRSRAIDDSIECVCTSVRELTQRLTWPRSTPGLLGHAVPVGWLVIEPLGSERNRGRRGGLAPRRSARIKRRVTSSRR